MGTKTENARCLFYCTFKSIHYTSPCSTDRHNQWIVSETWGIGEFKLVMRLKGVSQTINNIINTKIMKIHNNNYNYYYYCTHIQWAGFVLLV